MSERKSADERTADLLSAAERILERRNRITVSEMAREAGIASGTFYLYFPSKAHLEATLIERFIDRYVDAAVEAMAEPGTLLARLERTLAAMVRYSLTHRAVLRLQVTHAPTEETREIIVSGVDRMKALLTEALEAGAAEGELDLPDPAMTAAVLFHGTEGVMHDAITHDRDVTEERLMATLRHHLSALLGTPIGV